MAGNYFDRYNSKNTCNPELFYDSQMMMDSLTWRLCKKGTDGVSKVLLKGILQDTEISYSANHEYGSPNGFGKQIMTNVKDWQSRIKEWDMIRRTVPKQVSRYKNTNPNSKDYIGQANKLVANGLDTVYKGIDKLTNDVVEALPDTWRTTGKELLDTLGKMSEQAAYGNFISAFDFIKVYNGTSVTMSLPPLDAIVFDDDDYPIKQTITQLNDEFMGSLSDEAGIFGLQRGPGSSQESVGYKPTFDGLDPKTDFEGTYSLQFGDKYEITNLVVTNFSNKFSTIYRMNKSNKRSPLYSWIHVDLDFASFVSKEKINSWLINNM